MSIREGVFMSVKESFRYQIIIKYQNGDLNRKQAAEMLQTCERSVTRWSKKIKDRGIFGVKHGNFQCLPHNKYSDELKETVLDLFKNRYFDFNAKHFHEVLKKKYKISVSYKTIWSWLRSLRMIKNPRVKRRRMREYRHRMPSEGMLLQMDGCHHKFNGKDEWCLISAIDDASSDIPYAEFFDGETTQSCMKVLRRIIELKGLPKAIYTDRAGWAGGGKRINFSQFKRACDELGVQVIFANSPEGKGRIERSFRTIQDRLIPELREKGIKSMNEANNYLQEEFIPKTWKRSFTVLPDNPISAYSPANPFLDLNKILVVEEVRVVSRDNTVSWQGERFRLVNSRLSYGSYEATFKTDHSGETRIFVMDQEVFLEKVPNPTRLEDIDIPKEKLFELDSKHYHAMWKVVGEISREVNRSRVSGKPLKLPPKAS